MTNIPKYLKYGKTHGLLYKLCVFIAIVMNWIHTSLSMFSYISKKKKKCISLARHRLLYVLIH